MWRVRSAIQIRHHNRVLLPCRPLSSYHTDLNPRDKLSFVRQSRREIGFLAAVARSIVARVAVVTGAVGAAGYAIDDKIRAWEESTYRPIIEQLDRFKEVTKPTKHYFLNLKDQFNSQFNVQSASLDFNKLDSNPSEHQSNSDGDGENNSSSDPSPPKLPVVGAVTAAAVPLIAQEDEKEKELRAELDALQVELLDLAATKRELEKVIDGLNVTAETSEVARTELLTQIRELQDAASAQEVRHHKKVEKMDIEVNDLHARLATAQNQVRSVQKPGGPKSLVELYSTVLDELAHAKAVCPNIQSPDLPRVVVVGDQSSGKTSVLEAVARARIFPRGAGQMMTKSPVKVTVMDGPRHIASFPDKGSKIYRLDDESDLTALRSEIEKRMNKACSGQTISSETVSINIQGPGLRRMVLIDLPGIIATETAGIKAGTANQIVELAREQMSYDNAIILCVQDGSVDAERSQVTNFVRQADPSGERTLLVLTKVDRAVADPVRLKQILDGKLFPLRALGYFAVVSGTDDRDASISAIRKYENDFFQTSNLLRSGILKVEQLGTQNMCEAVSKIFWSLVKSSMTTELAKLKEQLFLLETEWKNKYKHARELDREQLFQKGKDVLLDRIVELQNLDPGEFESQLRARLWEDIQNHFLHEVYLAAEGNAKNNAEFNTITDIRLRKFTNTTLPYLSLRAANDLLREKFENLVIPTKGSNLFDKMFEKIKSETTKNFETFQDSIQAERMSDLKIIQQSTIDNRFIQSQTEWESAADRLIGNLKLDLTARWEKVYQLAGPLWYQQYWAWSTRTKDQFKWDRIKRILETLPHNSPSRLSKDEVAKTRFAVHKRFKVECSESDIDDVWEDLYPTRWIHDLQYRAVDCKRCYKKFKNGQISTNRSRLLCEDVLLWWRMERTIEMTAANLRQKMLTDDGVQKLSEDVKAVLSELTEDNVLELITGRQVDLAEELKYIRKIHKLLKELHEMLLRISH